MHTCLRKNHPFKTAREENTRLEFQRRTAAQLHSTVIDLLAVHWVNYEFQRDNLPVEEEQEVQANIECSDQTFDNCGRFNRSPANRLLATVYFFSQPTRLVCGRKLLCSGTREQLFGKFVFVVVTSGRRVACFAARDQLTGAWRKLIYANHRASFWECKA